MKTNATPHDSTERTLSLLGRWALFYAKTCGWAVFPLSPKSKKPFSGSHGFEDATKDPAQIEAGWTETPDANIGIATGKSSGVWILDIDPPAGAENMKILEAQNGELEQTLRQTTGRGGDQFFFRHPEEGVPCSTNKLAKNIDVRGDGGYVVLPPSIHPDGPAYRWFNDITPADIEVGDAPGWLVGLVQSTCANVAQVETNGTATGTNSAPGNGSAPDSDRITVAIRCLEALAPGRADDRDDWIQIGMALHHEDASGKMLARWDAFSRQSDKWKDGECARKWAGFHREGTATGAVGLKRLLDFAREDSGGLDFGKGFPETRERKTEGAKASSLKPGSDDESDDRPRIRLPGLGRPISEFVREITPLVTPGLDWFRSGGEVVRVDEGLIRPVSALQARTELEKVADFGIPRGRQKKEEARGWNSQTPSAQLCATVLEAPAFVRSLNRLDRICSVPLPYRDGDGLSCTVSGYNPDRRLYTTWTGDLPTILELEDAHAVFIELLGNFCFADDESGDWGSYATNFANAIGAILTPMCGLLFDGLIPAFSIVGNRAGLGKGELVKVAGIPVLGSLMGATAYTRDGEEMRKRLFAVARSGAEFLWLDDLSDHVKSPALNMAVTSAKISDRTLGKTQMREYPWRALIFMTGNHYTVEQDLVRRIVPIYLREDREDLDARTFRHEDLLGWALANRSKILGAIYGLIVHWEKKGAPLADLKFSSFTPWARLIGGILEAGGFPGFLRNRGNMAGAADPKTTDMRTLIEKAHDEFGSERFSPKQALELASEHELFSRITERDKGQAERLGRILSNFSGREFGGLKLMKWSKKPARYGITEVKKEGLEP